MNADIHKFKYLDSLRGVAILLVLLVHVPHLLVPAEYLPNLFEKLSEQGRMGVQLFYILSAITLFNSISKRSALEAYSTFKFFIRRFFRVAPLFYLASIFYFISYKYNYLTLPFSFPIISKASALAAHQALNTTNLLAHFTFLHGLSPSYINSIVPGGWSIAIEFTFYLLLPLLYLLYNKYGRAFLTSGFYISTLFLVLLNLLFQFIVKVDTTSELWQAYLYFYFPAQLPVFFLGMILYDYLFVLRPSNLTSTTLGSDIFKSKTIMIVLYSFLYFIFFYLLNNIFGIKVLGTSTIFLASLLFLFVIAVEKYKPYIIVNSILEYIGKVSYSMYLLHFVVVNIMSICFGSYIAARASAGMHYGVSAFILSYIVLVVGSIALSSLSYKYIEKPGIALGNYLIKRLLS